MKHLKAIGKAFVVAFSIYSKIPMPRFAWESEDMRYHLCFFPWVGALIGLVEWLWCKLCTVKGIDGFAFACIAIAIPLLITGGFHLDGFMDTCDALHSYQDKEKKLEILKDPHIGAFAVICLAALLCIAGGTLDIIYGIARENGTGMIDIQPAFLIPCMGFFLARTLSGISVVTMQGAKKKGMLQTFSDTAVKKTVLVFLFLQLFLCAAGMLMAGVMQGVIALVVAAASYWHYAAVSKKQFGGITGDLAGYFVCVTEVAILVANCIYALLGYGVF